MTYFIRKAFFLAALLLAISIGALVTMPAAQAAPPAKPLAAPGDCTVITTTDSVAGSLRACMLGLQPGATITFATSAFPLASPAAIQLQTPLNNIITDNVTIDGSSAGVILSGSSLSFGNGLTVDGASGVTIKGLQILNFPDDGLRLQNGATNNLIGGINATPGGSCTGDCNLISSNGADGVALRDTGTMSNTISGNYVGTDAAGAAALGNDGMGIWIVNGASNNTIGGSNATPSGNCTGACNLVSGNLDRGIVIENSGTMNNIVAGNYIGTNAGGTGAIPNLDNGLKIRGGASHNVIGGSTPNERNLISGNADAGIELEDSGTMSNTVTGNYIGTSANGSSALPNQSDGIWMAGGAQHNRIGGGSAGEGNLISGNSENGLMIEGTGTGNNIVQGNYIGMAINGTSPISNGIGGLRIQNGASNNTIGGSNATPGGNCTGECNLISGNDADGVALRDTGTMSNTISGNYIGLDVSGTIGLGNGVEDDGVGIRNGPAYNQIGGTTPGERNVIGGPRDDGVKLDAAMHNVVIGNFIGTNAAGTAAAGNGDGVKFQGGASHNRVGGNSPAERNLISGNSGDGVGIEDSSTMSNTIVGNYIGTDINGASDLGNSQSGVDIEGSAANNSIRNNLISGNDLNGITIEGGGSTDDAPLLDDVSLTINGGSNQISNGDFSSGLAHWGTYDYNGSPMASRVSNTSSYHSAPASYQFNRSSGSIGELVTVYDTAAQSVEYTTDPWDDPTNSMWIDVSPGDQLDLTFWYSGTLAVAEISGLYTDDDSDDIARSHLPPTTNWTQTILTATVPANVVKVGILFFVNDLPPVANNVVTGNTIGLDASGTNALPNQRHGVRIDNWAINNRVGGPNSGDSNTISSNGGDGIHVADSGTLYNTIQQNSIYNNVGLGISLEKGGNAELAPPSIITPNLTAGTVSGTACANCTVGIFSDDEDEGQVYEGNTTADGSGNWTLNKGSAFTGPNLTATATDSQGNTSEFGRSSYDLYLPLIIKSGS